MTRYERLRRGLGEQDCACAILVGSEHAVHLAGYSRYLSGPVAVVVSADGRRTLVVPRFELAAAEESTNADEVVPFGAGDFLDFKPMPKLAAACLERVTDPRVAVAGGIELFADAVEAVPVDDVLSRIRRVKDADELANLRRSYELTLGAQRHVEELAMEGATEIELFTAAQAWAQREAGAPVEFIAGVSTGPNSADVAPPVHVPGRRRAQPGEPVLVDVAVRHRGYWGDTTRTSVRGSNAEVEEARTVIAEILRESGRALRPGLAAAELFERMRSEILDRFPGGSFAHHGGHGIGISVAEDPQLVPSEPMQLEAGMVLAVEPAVYVPGHFGVRVEDMYVVTEDGGMFLSEVV